MSEMPKIKGMSQRKTILVLLLVFALTLLVGGLYSAYAEPEEAPSAALYAITWRDTVITTDTNSTAYTTQSYSYHDIFCSIDINAAQQITVTIQSSADNTTFFPTYELCDVIADTEIFTRVLSYGRYERVEFDVATSAQVTPTCKSVYFNTWTPPNYVNTKGF